MNGNVHIIGISKLYFLVLLSTMQELFIHTFTNPIIASINGSDACLLSWNCQEDINFKSTGPMGPRCPLPQGDIILQKRDMFDQQVMQDNGTEYDECLPLLAEDKDFCNSNGTFSRLLRQFGVIG